MTGNIVGISSPKKSEKITGKIGFYILNYRWLFKPDHIFFEGFFFKFENQPWPPSLYFSMGQLREEEEGDLVKCLKAVATPETEQHTLDAIILDGAVIVQMLPPGTVRTFEA